MDLLEKLEVSLGRWFGIEVILHWSFTLAFAIYVLLDWYYALVMGSVFIVVLLHEFGHSLMAKRLAVEVPRIVMYPIGGMAFINLPSDHYKELWITIAGPMVNLALVPVFGLLSMAFESQYLEVLVFSNLAIFIFNLLPAIPLDGGRIFRSILMIYNYSFISATSIAVGTSKILAVLMGSFALLTLNIMLLLIALFVYLGSDNEMRLAKHRFFVENSDFWREGRIPTQEEIEELLDRVENQV